MHSQQMSHPVSGKAVVGFLQPMLVDLVALALHGEQAQWHAYGRHLTAIDEQLELLVADTRRAAAEVARRVVTLGMPVDGRPATVATTTSLPEFSAGFAGEDKAVSAIVDQIDAAVARARNALGPLNRIDQVSHQIIANVLQVLERYRSTFAAQVASEQSMRAAAPSPGPVRGFS
jgi:starvation-inducible DNA-binding protein